jgi:glutathione S-transferase
MVPFLVDPNTGQEMFESADIVRYLEDTYAEPVR